MRALLLDLDNTLIDRDVAVARWLTSVVPRAEVEPLLELDRGGHGARGPFFAGVAQATDRTVAEVRRAFARALPELVALRPDADRLLRRFTGRTVVVSNGSGPLQRAKLAATGIGARVDHVLISGELGLEKPAPAIFRAALARAAVEPEEACMVGDHPVADVAGARALGIRAIRLRTRWFGDEDATADAGAVGSLDEVTW